MKFVALSTLVTHNKYNIKYSFLVSFYFQILIQSKLCILINSIVWNSIEICHPMCHLYAKLRRLYTIFCQYL